MDQQEIAAFANREPLQTRIEQRREKRRRELIAIIAVFGLIFVAWLLRSFIRSRSPEYALESIAAALKSHDVEQFDRYVKLDALTLVAYDDLTNNLFQYDRSLTPETHKVFLEFYQRIKPQLAQGAAESIRRYLASGEWTLPTGDDLLKGRQLGIDYDRFLERSQLRNSEFIAIERIAADASGKKDEATAVVKIRDTYTGTTFDLELALTQEKDGRWCVVALENYRDYLAAVSARQNEDIDSYIAATQPIVDEYNPYFRNQQRRFRAIIRRYNPLSDEQRQELADLIETETIPLLRNRQEKLNSCAIQAGSQYLARLRRRSTDLSIASWQHFIAGLKSRDQREMDTAETLHKSAIEVDLRIEDVIKRNTVSQEMPSIR